MDGERVNRPYNSYTVAKTNIGRFTIVQDKIEISGEYYDYSYDMSQDSICVLPINSDKEVVLIKQYRHALNEWMYEFPAGGVDNNIPLEAAKRELMEETGYISEKWLYIGTYPSSQGKSTSMVHLYVAYDVHFKSKKSEPTELIKVQKISLEKFEEMIHNYEFKHLAGIALWDLWNAHRGEKLY